MPGKQEEKEYGFGTLAIHAGQAADPRTGAVTVPISLATTFTQKTPGDFVYEYSRTANPTRDAYEACIAALEKGKHGLAFASGSAATATVLHLLKAGDHVISVDDVYGGTNRYFRRVATPANNLSFTFVDMNDEQAFRAAFTEKTKLVWLETPTNPTLKLTDIARTAAIAKEHGCLFVVDNTFMSSALQQPLTLGADIVLHSITKYMNGHSDVVGGVLAVKDDELNARLRFLQNGIGAVPSPFDCYMVMRGLKTLKLRMKQHSINALAVARLFEASDKVEKVIYPGLESHPQHDLAKKQMHDFGGMVSVVLKGDITQTRQFAEALKLFKIAESLGAVESLVNHPAIMTHASVPAEQRAKLGITDSLLRFSVGIEDTEDIIADLEQALEAIQL